MKSVMWVGALALTGVVAGQSADAAAQPQRRFPAPNAARPEQPLSRAHRPRRLRLAAMDLAGAAGEPIPLKISAPATVQASGAVLFIRNLPRQVLLSTGLDLGGGRWIVLANRIKDTRLVVSATAPSRRFALEVVLLGRDLRAELAAPVDFTVTISTPAKTPAN